MIVIALVSLAGDGGTTPASWSAWPGNTLRQDKTLSSLVSNQSITITEEREETLMTVGRKQRCCWSQFDIKKYYRKNSRNITKALICQFIYQSARTISPNCYCPPSVNITLKINQYIWFGLRIYFTLASWLVWKGAKSKLSTVNMSYVKSRINKIIRTHTFFTFVSITDQAHWICITANIHCSIVEITAFINDCIKGLRYFKK